ncbi:MAG: mannitol-1-phosphate 5-dehydrogenase [Microbacteriaceae bacterium]
MKAVHFGAGNIGRGFIGAVLQDAGFHVTFVDVNDELISQLSSASGYSVIETGPSAHTTRYTDFSALNSRSNPDEVVRRIADADVVTTSVGPTVLPYLAPLISRGIEARISSRPVVVMACENAIGATDTLKAAIAEIAAISADRAVFANTAVDRIVPVQPATSLDVVVEEFCEWAVETSHLGEHTPAIPGAHFVPALAPFIERKLFTVNTAHATAAYCGQRAGARTITEALAMPDVAATVDGVLAETTRVLLARHGFDPAEHQAYVDATLARFRNPDLDDDVERVGRQPLRKISRHERLVAPAAHLAEMGESPVHLLTAIGAALLFESETDAEVSTMVEALDHLSPEDFCTTHCGIDPHHPLWDQLTNVIRTSALARASYSS